MSGLHVAEENNSVTRHLHPARIEAEPQASTELIAGPVADVWARVATSY